MQDVKRLMSVHQKSICDFQVGNLVEVIDKNYLGSMRHAFVKSVAASGHLVELFYKPLTKKEMQGQTCKQLMYECDDADYVLANTFWVTPCSRLFHPVGWAKDVGHTIDQPWLVLVFLNVVHLN